MLENLVNSNLSSLQHSADPSYTPGARFSKAPESFRARKAIFRSSVSKNGEVYTLETSCMKGTSLHLPSTLEYVSKTALYSQGSRFCNGPEKFPGLSRNGPLARVVQKLDNAIHWINHYPADSMVCFVDIYPLDSDLSGG